MSFIADLHLHSRFAYACSKSLNLTNMAAWAKVKGINLLSGADFTHPAWLAELEDNLTPVADGYFQFDDMKFVLGTEVSCVFSQGSHSRRVHMLLFVPTFDVVHRIRAMLEGLGSKLSGDGRPIVGIPARELAARLFDIDESCMLVPAHIWTPWYGLLGSKSGFNSLEECFGDMAVHIPAVETGLSSDPEMNWRVSGLKGKTIVSFSDAHSLPNMGRELTVFEGNASYHDLVAGLNGNLVERTLEFFPEAGKYHFSGHRKCSVSQSADETARFGNICPACGRPMTLGVVHRVQELSSETDWSEEGFNRPYTKLVPLIELVAYSMGKGRTAKPVSSAYQRICAELGGEVKVLTQVGYDDLYQVGGEDLAETVTKVRQGSVQITAGFDGQYGVVQPE